jgi:hypothetical protein
MGKLFHVTHIWRVQENGDGKGNGEAQGEVQECFDVGKTVGLNPTQTRWQEQAGNQCIILND